MTVDNQTLVIVLGFIATMYQSYKNAQLRDDQHAEQIAATTQAANAASAAYHEANSVNNKIAALQESSNAASGIPANPYVNPDNAVLPIVHSELKKDTDHY